MQSASSKKKILVKSFPLQGNDFFFFFLIYVGVRASLRAPRLISRPTEHPANSVGM
jgi:hypothetical protein